MLTQYGRQPRLASAFRPSLIALTLALLPAAPPALAQPAPNAPPALAQPAPNAPALAQPAPAAVSASSWLQQQFALNDAGRAAAPINAPDTISDALATWDWLRRTPKVGAEPPLSVQAQFLRAHGDWPAAATIRRRAEAQASDPAKSSDAQALDFFRQLPPQSADGLARFAQLSAGADAMRLARAAWAAGPGLGPTQEADLLGRFGAGFSAAENAAHIDQLIWAGQLSAAGRLLSWIEGAARQTAQARIALRSNAANADALYAALPAAARRNAGVTYDRALWLERNGRAGDAEALLAAGGTDAGATAPVTWMSKRLAMGRAAMRRGDNQLAYQLLAGHNAYASGTDLASRPLRERVVFSDSEWLAGWIALRKLGQANDARARFTTFLAAVTTPISRSRGEYWLGRAEQARGDQAAALRAFGRASSFADYYYGQLAAEQMGRKPALLMIPRLKVTPSMLAKFEAKPVVAALKLLVGLNDEARTALFVRAVANAATTPTEALAAGNLGQRLGRPDLGVWTWKNDRGSGNVESFATAFPTLPATTAVPTGDWVIAHAIIRQESSFNQSAVSPAGARGLMQLMPATAQDVARRMGVDYSAPRLLSDPAYNVSLGSYYINMRRSDFANDMMAIAAYNAGAGNVRKWVAMNGDPRTPGVDPIDWVEMIPFEETRTYVQRVIENGVVYSLVNPGRPDAVPSPSRWLRR